MQQEIQKLIDRIIEQKWSDFLHVGLELMPDDVVRLYTGFADQVRSLERVRVVRRVRGVVSWLTGLYSQVLGVLQELPLLDRGEVALVSYLESRLPRRRTNGEFLASLRLEEGFRNEYALDGASDCRMVRPCVTWPLDRDAPADGLCLLWLGPRQTGRIGTLKGNSRNGQQQAVFSRHRHRFYDLQGGHPLGRG